MFDIFKKKCSVCKMNLEKGKEYPQEGSKKFCSESCKEEDKKKSSEKAGEHSSHSGGCCH